MIVSDVTAVLRHSHTVQHTRHRSISEHLLPDEAWEREVWAAGKQGERARRHEVDSVGFGCNTT